MAKYTIHRIDKNQPEIQEAFEKRGATVTSMTGLSSGVADLLVGYRGFNIPVEVKQPNGNLRESQIHWHLNHEGNAFVVRTKEGANYLLCAYDRLCNLLGIDRLEVRGVNLEVVKKGQTANQG